MSQPEHTDTDEGVIRLTREDEGKKFTIPTGDAHEFVLGRLAALLLEVEDVHFHFDSPVMMPDHGDCKAPADEADTNHVSGLAVLRATYLHAERMPSNQLLLAGHTDRSGGDSYNQTLSEKRADNVLHLLLGERDAWVDICDGQHKTEDIQQILIWVNATFGWPCHPGPKDNVHGTQTTAGIRGFQSTYNDFERADATGFEPKLAVDGVVGPKTWGGFFDVYMLGMERLLKTDAAGVEKKQQSLTFVDDGQKRMGLGEKHPITENKPENFRSRIDRRVEILFFDPPHLPDLGRNGDDLYGPGRLFDFEPLPCDPDEVGVEFRIRLELGDIDRLFPVIGTPGPADPGVRQRLQATGFLYEPLTSPDIADRATHAWNHFKEVVGIAANADAAVRLREMLPEVYLANGVLPEAGAFGRLRLPGTFCVTNADFNGGFFGNPAGAIHPRYQSETAMWSANANLGRVPIVAIVEENRGSAWAEAPAGVRVHFQLVAADAVPAGDNTATTFRAAVAAGSSNTTTTLPSPRVFTMTGSPNKYVTDEQARNAVAAGDPLANNAHHTVGGKRGRTVAGSNREQNLLLAGTTHAGFHDHFDFTQAAASGHANAVVAETNAKGRAAAVFMPARTGGDRYKLRAFLDPVPEPGNDQASQGTEPFAVAADTGTMVLWRILRFSKYMRWDYPGAATDPNHATHFVRGGGALNNFGFTGLISTEFGRAWMDVTVEAKAQAPQNITQAQWRQAIQFARGRIVPATSQNYNLSALLPDTTGTAGVHNNNAGLIRFTTAAQYNAARGAGFDPAPANNTFLSDCAGLMHNMSSEIMEFFTHNAIGGMTVIQAPMMTSVESDSPVLPNGRLAIMSSPSSGNWMRSGWGGMRRGCYVTFGNNVYSGAGFPYDHNRNAMHELGHTAYCPHQYTDAAQVNVGPGGSTGGGFDEHDYHDLCVMGYMQRRTTAGGGDFCGRCMLLFAGWDTHGMPANHPGP